jgi:DNA-binding MarR family transcriptional regulator
MSSRPGTGNQVEGRGPYIGSMMRTTHRWLMEHLYRHVVGSGFDDLTRAHVSLFRYPSPEGLRPSELAERLDVTKQSVNDLLHDLEARGYLVREADPSDGRARVIRLTERGRALEVAVYEGAESAQQAVADLVGAARFTKLRDTLREVSTRIAAGELD